MLSYIGVADRSAVLWLVPYLFICIRMPVPVFLALQCILLLWHGDSPRDSLGFLVRHSSGFQHLSPPSKWFPLQGHLHVSCWQSTFESSWRFGKASYRSGWNRLPGNIVYQQVPSSESDENQKISS
ncbi:hypothetical protein AVEN_230205-1 [Araneus ventricosus]|uniref:Uncharacterized protein n=1 Tax=Araneus ventricosus TaxID=182803 RepID=A0A4Y2KV74_ARAVE|nr:hypothetical protein AVEN_230205-1 [Araneus ventricosus]